MHFPLSFLKCLELLLCLNLECIFWSSSTHIDIQNESLLPCTHIRPLMCISVQRNANLGLSIGTKLTS